MFFVLLFLFQAIGSFLLFHFQQKAIRREIKAAIRAEIKREQLEWIVLEDTTFSENEFDYNNSRYDVITSEICNGKLYLHCLNDHLEHQLIKNFQDNHQKEQKALKLNPKNPIIILGSFEKLRVHNIIFFNTVSFHYFSHQTSFEPTPAVPPPNVYLITSIFFS